MQDPIFIVMAIEFMATDSGSTLPVLNSQFNCMQLIAADAAPKQQSLPQGEALIVAETGRPFHS